MLGAMKSQQRVSPAAVEKYVEQIAGEDLHPKRVLSLANTTLGVIRSGALAIHLIGLGLALSRDLNRKHATKQVDRLLSNRGVNVWDFFANWVPAVIGERSDAIVALDWTDFEADDQVTLCAHLITGRGRATPLVWLTGYKSKMLGMQNDFIELVLRRLKEVLPVAVKRVTVLADRGFGGVPQYQLLRELGLDFVVRFRSDITVRDARGLVGPAAGWVPDSGRPLLIRSAKVTVDEYELGAVALVKKPAMKEVLAPALHR